MHAALVCAEPLIGLLERVASSLVFASHWAARKNRLATWLNALNCNAAMTQHSRLFQRNLTEFFRELLQRAMEAQAVRSSEDVEFYLVTLLEHFAHPRRRFDDRPLALDYLESFHAPLPHRYGKLKHVGDTALFMAGLFLEALHRKIVSSDYYTELGRTAYSQLARLGGAAGPRSRDLFAELADRFPELVRVLAEISFRDLFPGDEHALRAYTRWLYTRSELDAHWLMKQGLIPYAPTKRTTH
ncbi:MAG: hypothetical protein N3C12_15360 [Candidatus Binatia bacterium]|nr:hypothetical protein [Candidatus Binatia bacterium]